MSLLLIGIPITAIIIIFVWLSSELKNNKCWIRITLGGLAILCCWGIAIMAAQIVRLNYNIWYSDATKKLITVTVEKLEAGEKSLVIEELKKLKEQLHVTYEFKGNYDELVREAVKDMTKEAKKGSKLKPKSAEAYYSSGNTKSILKQYKEAIENYDKAIKLSPQIAVIHKNVNLKPEQYLKAVNDSNKAVKLARYYSSRGSAQYQLKQYKEAIKDYDEAIKLSHYKKNIYKNLKSKYNKVIELPMYYSARGAAKHKLKQYKEAIKDYDKAIELYPKNVSAYFHRGNLKKKLKQYKEAIKDFDKVIELEPKYIEAYVYRGVSKGKLKQYKEAIKDYDQAVGLNPKYISIYDYRGYGNIKSKQYKEAIKNFDRTIETNHGFANAYANRGLTNLHLKKYKEARTDLLKAKKLAKKQKNMKILKAVEKNLHELYEAKKKEKLQK